ncbi:R3H domain-containing protein 1 [Selaginella moellendorffii]|nr:R3H domain-containing protein 1 [Selaginella moellendorffii]XP_024522717.1 R3H domain-containing protein 1 [Selaginella moellendorffii]|eukprot:XP_002993247.2 R3H domain-containing protein 1 [Selaginella moellendorffii]
MGDRQIEVVGVRVDDGRKILLVKPTVVPPEIVSDQVDNFLLEALQNPRDRLTVLRLEQEIQKFAKNAEVQQLEFQPMGSPFCQLATQRVAQHYGLKTSVVESSGGARIHVTKSLDGENRQSGIRLADIPPRVAQALQPRVAIKQRGAPAGYRDKRNSKVDSSKSVEERKEEYNRARARIFQEDSSDDDSVKDCCHIEVVRVENKDEAAKANKETRAETTVPRICTKDDKENVRRIFKEENAIKPKPSTPNRVAIIRDREKDRKDPDYDRSYDRYLQRYDRGFGGLMAHPVSPAYNTQFDACIQQPAQSLCSSWVSPTYNPAASSGSPIQMGGTRGSFVMDSTSYSSYAPYQSQDPRFFHDGFFSSSSSFQAFNTLEAPQQHYQMAVLPSYNMVNLHSRQHY